MAEHPLFPISADEPCPAEWAGSRLAKGAEQGVEQFNPH